MSSINKIIDKIEENKKYHFWCFFAVLIFLSAFMMFSYNLHPSHDFYFHYKRLNALMDAISNGTFPIYIDSTAANGYGYATKWFYSDFILIPFAFIGIVTNAVLAYKSMLFTMTVLCGLLMYYVVNRIYKNPYAASISSLLFTFCTYRLLDLYVRSAVGEAISFTFLPIVFLGLYEIIKGNYKKWYILTIGYSLLIFTHVLSTFLMFITTLVILVICYKTFVNNKKRIYYLVLAGFATILVTAYSLYPMLEQMLGGTYYYETVVKAHPNEHKQGLNWIVWGMFGGIVHPKQIFIPGIGILLTWAIGLRLFVNEKKSNLLKSVDVGVIIGLVYIGFISSLIPWHTFPFSKLYFIQLPWRLYEFVSFFFALAGGYYLSKILISNKRRFVGSLLVILCTIFVISSSGKDYQYENSAKDINEIPTKKSSNFHLYGMEYVPTKVPSIDYIEERGNRIDTQHEETSITNFSKVEGITSFDIQIDNSEKVELPLFSYKGYKATLNDKEIPIYESEHGLIEIPVNESGKVKITYAGTVIQKVSPFISILSIFALCIYIFSINRKKNNA